MRNEHQGDSGWADNPGVKRRIRLVLYGVCAVLLLAELFVDRHPENALEALPEFYALYGLVSLIAAVLAAKGLRRLVGRNESYYDDHG